MSEVAVAQRETNDAANEVAQAEAEGKPVGMKAFVRWVAPLLNEGKTLDEITEAYPAPVKKASMSAKLSTARKWCREHNIELPQATRAGRSDSDTEDLDEFAAELNLKRILEE